MTKWISYRSKLNTQLNHLMIPITCLLSLELKFFTKTFILGSVPVIVTAHLFYELAFCHGLLLQSHRHTIKYIYIFVFQVLSEADTEPRIQV